MNVPVCTNHGKPMRQFPWGFKCTTMIGTAPDGTKIWCNQRIKNPGAEFQAPASNMLTGLTDKEATSLSSMAHRGGSAEAALDFAARVFQGHPDKWTDAIAVAKMVYSEFLLPIYEPKE